MNYKQTSRANTDRRLSTRGLCARANEPKDNMGTGAITNGTQMRTWDGEANKTSIQRSNRKAGMQHSKQARS